MTTNPAVPARAAYLAQSTINNVELAEARNIVASCRRELGAGHSLTDLLLDNLPQLTSVDDARRLLAELGEGLKS